MKNMMKCMLCGLRNGKLSRIPQNSLKYQNGGANFKRNFIIYLVNCFFNGPENRCCSKPILKFIKDVIQIASLDWGQFILDELITNVRHYKETSNDSGAPSLSPTLSLHKPDSEDQISGTALVADASVTVKKEDHHEDVVLDQPNNVMKKDDSIPLYSLRLGLSQSDSQSLTTSMLDPSTAGVSEDDDGGTSLRFPLRNTSQVNHELSTKKPAENKPKEGNEPSSKRGEVSKHNIKIKKSTLHQTSGSKQAPDSSKPKLTKEVLPEKDHEKCVGAVITPENLLLPACDPADKAKSELSQDELLISEYVFGKVEDVDDNEPLFDGCSDKEATKVFMATLKPGEEIEMNVINI
ncbi:LOW QUALITY PROTEIN: hypothetical protein Cgig2_022630 [Carnegiea gigantea]|uniref:Uncharacterized protein n=1 Tax=Carnegiea gigantea TaxID=171969 RepID=A0A9Q1JNE5_9CARY|nr:LOW QUALITY PROTEIN: hypothetical protein Cgig2_022630 [Carnegiea gigantea]